MPNVPILSRVKANEARPVLTADWPVQVEEETTLKRENASRSNKTSPLEQQGGLYQMFDLFTALVGFTPLV